MVNDCSHTEILHRHREVFVWKTALISLCLVSPFTLELSLGTFPLIYLGISYPVFIALISDSASTPDTEMHSPPLISLSLQLLPSPLFSLLPHLSRWPLHLHAFPAACRISITSSHFCSSPAALHLSERHPLLLSTLPITLSFILPHSTHNFAVFSDGRSWLVLSAV